MPVRRWGYLPGGGSHRNAGDRSHDQHDVPGEYIAEQRAGTFYQRLHALDLATGNEKFSAPVNIAASVPGNGDGSSGGMVSFNAQMQNQRPALALAGGTVYVGWSAHEDASPWHGWLIGYSASNVQQQASVFNTSPNGGMGGIWASGGAPAVDSDGEHLCLNRQRRVRCQQYHSAR